MSKRLPMSTPFIIWAFLSVTDKIADDCSATTSTTPAVAAVPVGISTLLWHVYDK